MLIILFKADECADASRTLAHDDPKFSETEAQSVDQHCALSPEKLFGTM